MKRCRGGAETASINVPDVLTLLSHGKEEADAAITRPPPPPRVFECKTCSRRFPSFQALGGHRASHKRPKLAGCCQGELRKPRAHECAVCGLEFAIGQALGGHMRRHRAQHGAAAAEITRSGEKKGPWLDLNMPPGEGDGGDYREKSFGIVLMDHATPVVDCFH